MVSFAPLPLYLQGKSPRHPLDRRLGGPLSPSGRREEKILDFTATRTATPRSTSTQPVAIPAPTYFQFEDKLDQRKEGMAMGNSLSSVVSNIRIEHFEEIASDTADYKPTKWLAYIDDTFVVWPHNQQDFSNLNRGLRFITVTRKVRADTSI
jgi:hypothetical protein